MGKLRLEPKLKPPVNEEQYIYYRGILQEAVSAASGNNVYYDLDPGENPRKVRRAILYVAEKEGISVKARSARGARSLVLKFDGGRPQPAGARMSAAEARKRILAVLAKADGPMKKADILNKTGISPATWNLRINELLTDGSVKRVGVGRQTSYTAA
ncbi:MAG: hypothetical protein Kow001_11560 [Acidobacteriota bacterium]